MRTHFDKPIAVVTGASSGIGYELAKQFAMHGFDLIVAAEDRAIEDIRPALEAFGANVEAVQVDLSSYIETEGFAADINALGLPISALALNAGVGVGGEFARTTDLDAELALIRLNVQSLVHLTKRLVTGMVARGEGRILFTSSLAATSPGPYLAVYAASKAFVQSFAEALRFELKDTGVTVTSLMPGATDTKFFQRANMENTKVGQGPKDDPADVAEEGFAALIAGKDHVVTGLKNKVQGTLSKVLPETVTASMQAAQTRPGSGL
ncbi:MAG: SDR family NAD(P)-dependent oxidoreductase [Bdellovibrionota bacterium]